MEDLVTLKNFTLIKYRHHYVLTIDVGAPLIFQNKNLAALLKDLHDYLERIKRSADKPKPKELI